ncbi:histidine kinase [Streptomyces sp. A3M-1-3]|uniref:sensor histidine kinase n=1 Tax=Streptomyces sp. A3M-1-3 TaxID=2962044 RepID=UPI0020B8C17A|nr:histidine kinase [Streptomyces sp. A3M-1-3]MCP3821323.1 histidine kinase [Streptomyces sp. A3M-1-3]
MTILLGARARLRWVHLILGGALLMPYFLVGSVVVGPFTEDQNVFSSLPLQLGAYAVALPLAAVSALFPLTRPMSVAAVRAMCGVPAEQLADGPARSRAARLRTSAWYTLHVGLGALVSGTTLALPPMAVVLIVLPLFAGLRDSRLGLPEFFGTPAGLVLAPVIGVASLLALAACAAGAGALLARLAPVLLGPTPADRLAAAEERAADLALRNRLARELHDSVGHALSAVTLQAGAARRVLDSDRPADREFVREALAAIEDTTRRTVGELDAVLGLLREGDEARETAPAPTLATDLDGLLDRTRAAGAGVTVTVTVTEQAGHGWAALPPVVSREAYRIVQEGLSNALRHGGATPVQLRIAVTGEELEITMTNPLPGRTDPAARATGPRTTGGRGLRGAAERAALLGGHTEAGPRDGAWRLTARLPLGGTR